MVTAYLMLFRSLGRGGLPGNRWPIWQEKNLFLIFYSSPASRPLRLLLLLSLPHLHRRLNSTSLCIHSSTHPSSSQPQSPLHRNHVGKHARGRPAGQVDPRHAREYPSCTLHPRHAPAHPRSTPLQAQCLDAPPQALFESLRSCEPSCLVPESGALTCPRSSLRPPANHRSLRASWSTSSVRTLAALHSQQSSCTSFVAGPGRVASSGTLRCSEEAVEANGPQWVVSPPPSPRPPLPLLSASSS